eukprot:g1349.t1
MLVPTVARRAASVVGGGRALFSTSRNRRSSGVDRKFVDKVRVSLTGGPGGLGCNSHEHLAPGKKRANGGNAGNGGDVIIRTNAQLRSLTIGKHHYRALGGANGGPNKRTGRHGKNVYLEVPVGTVVKEIWKGFDEETGDVTEGVVKEHDLDEEGAFVVGASGGRGGRGNQYMVKSESEAKEYFRRQRERREEEGEEDGGFEIPGLEGFVFDNEADREQFDFLLEDGGGLEAKKKLPNEGEVGEQRYYELELKLIADVGLVGYPNAGKSTLLGALSRAKPKVAPYPFTTLHPFVGTVEFADAYRFLVADTPGLIDGAHENIGLGHQFLRHIERNKILAFVIDISDEHGPKAGDALTALERELNLYAPGLGDQDAVILANKIDVPTSKESFQRDQYESLQAASKGRPIFPISAKESNGVDRVVLHLRSMLETQEDREQAS